ncbi:DUF3899 domain-containing protein [Oceanirhabdus sp. W0125-5]|uniref:DUF3899 domain-containing protein n=1 Tax=Oceanirhabdus sp. W0125-5 TaxID=2999116 RepID=UPI0022F2BC94|nr:DUF3899 domain-containing protein [Oceanirhabdus sp. W0125-5]WBW95379.1 DUF3899 domain-containing protein [Oceanirhabdus sp. W0125-5]
MKILSIVTPVFTLLFLFFDKTENLTLKFSNAFFYLGLLYLCIALMIHVRNSGLFKFVKYHKFKKEQKMLKSSGVLDPDEEESGKNNFDKFHNFLQKAYGVQYPSKVYYLFAVPLLSLSMLLAYIYKSTM